MPNLSSHISQQDIKSLVTMNDCLSVESWHCDIWCTVYFRHNHTRYASCGIYIEIMLSDIWYDTVLVFMRVPCTTNTLVVDRYKKSCLPTVILISFPSPTHSFIPGLKSFSSNPSHRSLPFLFFRTDSTDSPDCLLLLLSVSVFIFFSVLHFLVVVSVR